MSETENHSGSPCESVRPHPTCQTCRPVLTGGEIALRCCIDSPSGCFNVLSAQGARLAIHVSLPTREYSRDLFFSFRSFFFFALYNFARQHTLVRTVSPALCRFARSDTPWPQGSRTYSAQKKFTCPGHTDRPILLHILLILLRGCRQEHSGLGSWRSTSELILLRDSPTDVPSGLYGSGV